VRYTIPPIQALWFIPPQCPLATAAELVNAAAAPAVKAAAPTSAACALLAALARAADAYQLLAVDPSDGTDAVVPTTDGVPAWPAQATSTTPVPTTAVWAAALNVLAACARLATSADLPRPTLIEFLKAATAVRPTTASASPPTATDTDRRVLGMRDHCKSWTLPISG